MDRIATAWEPRFAAEAAKQLELDKRGVLATLHKAQTQAVERKATIDWSAIDQDAEYFLKAAGDRWRKAFIPLIQGLITQQGIEWSAQFGLQFSVRQLFAESWWSEYTLKFAQGPTSPTQTTLDTIKGILTQALEEGWSNPTTQKRISDTFDQWIHGDKKPEDFDWIQERTPAYRVEMISRSESIRASGAGADALYKDWGVEYKEWYTADDERRCPWCAEMHGKQLPVGDNWFAKGDTFSAGEGEAARTMKLDFDDVGFPPLHPNCRCTLLPVIPEEGELQQ